jgi:hypothetical protein
VEAGVAGKAWSLSNLQAVVALVAGLSSIVGGAYSMVAAVRTPPTGDIVADVREAGTAKPVPAAIVEVFTPDDTLVTTMKADGDGASRRTVAPGAYRVRAVHPDYVAAVRDVQVMPDGTAELHLALDRKAHPRATTPAAPPRAGAQSHAAAPVGEATARAIDRGVGRLLGRIGF